MRRYIMLPAVVLAVVALLFAATQAVADNGGPTPCDNDYPCNMTNLDTFLTNECGNYFNPIGASAIEDVCEPITEFDFVGTWYIAAIALEADYDITVAEDPAMGVSFRSEDCSNWGLFKEINFDVANLVFTDHYPSPDYVVSLDPFCGGGIGPNCNDFKVCRLKQDSNLLSYLTNPISLRAGDLIIGFEDTAGDGDYEDIVIVARQESRASLMPTLVESTTPFSHTEEGTGKTCSISIEEGKLPSINAIHITGDCTAVVKLLTELTFGTPVGTPGEKAVTSFPLRKWIGTHGSPGEFTYCYPSGYCVVFTF